MTKPIFATTIKLSDGRSMPRVGLGTFQGAYDYKSSFDTAVASVRSALDTGYRHFDTALLYRTEEGIGHAINEYIREEKVKREDMFVTTKLWSTSHRQKDVVPALKESLKNLGMDYVDMYLVHWPIAIPPGNGDFCADADGNTQFEDDKVSLMDTWRGMEECKDLGLAKSIGVSNFNRAQLQEILDNCKHKPTNNQVESHPFFCNEKLKAFCAKNGIVMTCFSPLGKPGRAWKAETDPDVFLNTTLSAIAAKYNKTSAQVALRFQIQRGNVVVPKSITPQRQRENINIFDFELSDEDMETIFKDCDKNFRILQLRDKLGGSTQYPFNTEY